MSTPYFKNNWRLSKERFTKSYFKLNCKYNEHTPVELVQAFVKNKQGVSLKHNKVLKTKYDNEETQMTEYLNNFDKKTNVFKVKYALPTHKWGRLNPEKSLSLCVFHRPTRHAYCKGIYVDIDMKNAHPVFIKNLCESNGIPCPNITRYCDDRDAFLGRVGDHHNVDKEASKRLILRLTYGGDYNRWLSEIELKQQEWKTAMPEILEYEAEMVTVRDLVFQHNDHIIADVEKSNPAYFKNPKYKTPEDVLRKKKKTCMSHFCCTIERYLQEACIKHLVENKGVNLMDVVPCQDGLMILRDFFFENILTECEDVILNTIGFKIELKVKEFDEACHIPINSANETEDTTDETAQREMAEMIQSGDDKILWDTLSLSVQMTDEDDNKIRGFTDYDLAKIVHHYYKDRFVCVSVKDNAWYEFSGHKWTGCDSGSVLRQLISDGLREKYASILKILAKGVGGNKKANDKKKHIVLSIIDKLGKTNDKNNIMRECKDIFYSPNFEKRLDENIHLLCFTNGVFDSNALVFRDGTPEDMCLLCMNIPLTPLSDEQVIYKDDVKRRLFTEPLGEAVSEYFILNIARGLMGKRLKRILFGIGMSNSGKSTVTTGCKNAFGDYFGSFNGENLAYRKSSNDEAQNMRWALLLKNKRVIFSNEMKSTVELNGNMIKKISSGGDSLIGRNHCQAETEFVPNFLAVCMSNDLNKIKPYDTAISNRLRIIPYTREFVDEPANETELKKNPLLDAEMRTDEFKQVFVNIFIQAFVDFVDGKILDIEPPEVISAKQEWTGDDGTGSNHMTAFLKDFEITNDPQHCVVSSDIQAWVEKKDFGISHIAFTKEMKKYCAVHNLGNVEPKNKKISGKVVKAWFGMRKFVYTPEDDHEEDHGEEHEGVEYELEEV